MMKKLLKKTTLLLLLLFVTSTYAQFTVTFDKVPTKIEENGGLASNDLLIITVDNIPNNNTNAEVVVQVRMMPNGSGNIGNTPRITQMDLDTNHSTADGTVDANHSIVTTAGTNADTFKRTFTVNNLVTQGGNTFAIGTDNHYAGVRVKNFVGTPSNNEFRHEATAENGWSGTIDGVADNTLSISNKKNISGSIYPNPVSSVLNISKSVNTKTYKVVNLLGQTIKQVNATGSINVSDLSAGMYILFTDAGNARFIKK
ncbi:T9SS type A sorting domain-containing protein [Formosa sp. PL04]|uniref:T9SS type A sorting domain-containing protein n=1 Tax=Formosa sp. PL04 TaxID=3081755 RepID=UPI0029815AD0|nr:T9SS type A sorting domain-containing protein [Formosa sp. PL04]MDW5290829.1 T9SS type A sorting domain-containing protein [Formosa sp. PL04]